MMGEKLDVKQSYEGNLAQTWGVKGFLEEVA